MLLGVAVLWALPNAGVHVLKPYQVDRLTSFLHPNRNTLAEGYNQSQAKIAVGAGGLVGRGKSGATQTLNDFLPERRTDFVFAVLGEERGFVGAMLLLGLYLVVLWRILRAIAVARTLYARLICAGVFGWILASVFISVGMTIAITVFNLILGALALLGIGLAASRRRPADRLLLLLAAGSLLAGILSNPGGAPNTLRVSALAAPAAVFAAAVLETVFSALAGAGVAARGVLAAGLAAVLAAAETLPVLVRYPERPGVAAAR